VNDRILELEDGFGPREPATMLAAFVCECATVGCTTRVQMSVEEYRFARVRPERFLVAPGHVDPDHERVVMATGALHAGREVQPRRRDRRVL